MNARTRERNLWTVDGKSSCGMRDVWNGRCSCWGVNVEGKPLGVDLVIHTDPEWFDGILGMSDWHENRHLWELATDVLG